MKISRLLDTTRENSAISNRCFDIFDISKHHYHKVENSSIFNCVQSVFVIVCRSELAAMNLWMSTTTVLQVLYPTSSHLSSSTFCSASSSLSGLSAATTGCCQSGRPTTTRHWQSQTRGATRPPTCLHWSSWASVTAWCSSSSCSLVFSWSVNKSGPVKCSVSVTITLANVDRF